MIVTFILFILILGITVLVHELGHFLMAKKVGVHVYEFSIGFGPLLFKKIAKDNTQYSFRTLPLGGYVSLAGEEEGYEKNGHSGRNLQDKPAFQRFLVMVMGVVNNFLFAFIVLLLAALLYGASSMDPIITSVDKSYPAGIAGLKDNDLVLEINNKKVTYLDDISLYMTLSDMEKPIIFKVKHEDGSIEILKVKPEKEIVDGVEKYVVGISLMRKVEKGFIPSVVYAFKQEMAIFKQMFVVLGNLFTGKLSINKLSGPVGIFNVVGSVKSQGLAAILSLIALLCVNVGVINLLPFPAFDGGRIFLLIIEKIKGKPLNPKLEYTINSVGFILLMILMIYITFNDILKLF